MNTELHLNNNYLVAQTQSIHNWDESCDYSDGFEEHQRHEMSCCDRPALKLPKTRKPDSLEWEWRDDFMCQDDVLSAFNQHESSYITAKWAENVEMTHPNFDCISQRSDAETLPTFLSENWH